MLLLSIKGNLIAFVIWIASGLYKVAAFVFQIFLVLSTNELVDSKVYDQMISNFYAVLGVILLFFLVFSFLKAMVDPDNDKLGTSAVKQVIINLVTSTIIMALLPTIFGFLYDMQHAILVNQNTIGRFFNYGAIDSQASQNATSQVNRGAFQIANGVFTAFLNVSDDAFQSNGACANVDNKDIKDCQQLIAGESGRSLYQVMSLVDSDGHFGRYTDFAENVDAGDVDFQWLLSLAGGVALLYVGISYCFDMALRMIKLVFYQLIAPIPVFARVIPDTKLSGSFNEWIKVTLACYFEVYVRIFVLYFVVFLCTTMLKAGNFLDDRIYQYGTFVGLFGKAFILMGIVMFMKQAPKLISEVTGIDTGNMNLGIKNKLKEGGFFTAGAVLGSGATALTRNATNAVKDIKNKWATSSGKDKLKLIAGGLGSTIAGGASGMVRGGRAGWGAGSFSDMSSAAGSGARGAVDARDRRAAYKAAHGGTALGVAKGHVLDTVDTVGRWAGFNNIEELTEKSQSVDAVTGKVDKVVDNARSMINAQANKGKQYTFGVSGINKATGIEYSLDAYRKVSDLKDRAASSGQAQDMSGVISEKKIYDHTVENARRIAAARGIKDFKVSDYAFLDDGTPLDTAQITKRLEQEFEGSSKYNADEIQRIFGKYENDYSKEVANQAFLSDEHYESYLKDSRTSLEEQAAMTAVRSAAVDARYELERKIGSDLIQRSNVNMTEFRDDGKTRNVALDATTVKGDLKVTEGSALDKMGATAKIIKAEIDDEKAKIQQREKDKEGK